MRALVSVLDVLDVVTTHLDRMHDAAIRLGCGAEQAQEATTAAVHELVADLAHAPETVGDLVGGAYARCYEAARRRRGGVVAPVGAGGLLGGDEEARAVAAALAELPERRRLGVLLIDSYAVTYAQTAVALELDTAETGRAVALGRAALVAAVDGREAPTMAGHDVAIGDLGQLSDGSAPAGGRFAGLRKHVSSCAVCAETLGIQTRGKAMVAALPVLVLPEESRTALLRRAEQEATALLPSADEVAAELAGEVAAEPLIPRWVWVAALLAALLLGGALGALLIHHGTANAALTAPAATGSGSTSAPPTVSSSSAATTSAAATTTAATSTRPPAATRSVPPPPPTTTAASPAATTTAAAASVAISPPSGPAGTSVTVSGRGFRPAALVTVTYARSDGTPGSSAQTTTDASGAFTVTVTATDPPTPGGLLAPPVSHAGAHTISASDGARSASASFEQTS